MPGPTAARLDAPIDRQDVFNAYRTARRAYSDDWLKPNEAHLVTATAGVQNLSPYIAFGAGATSSAYWTLEKRDMWTMGGQMRFTMLYAGSAADVSTFSMQIAASEIALGEDYTVGADLSNTDTIAGPAAVPVVERHVFDTTLTITGGGAYIGIRMRRPNTDAYSGEIRVFGLKTEYLARR